jgi:MoaA/NifB/PqqE/SkfB family radical SAM enzyme
MAKFESGDKREPAAAGGGVCGPPGPRPDQLYDAWLVWFPTYRCFFNCAYCFFLNPLKKTAPSPPIDIPALVSALDHSGKIIRLSFGGGGEPFTVPNLVQACQAVTRNHFISFTTNLISKKVEDFAATIDPRRVVLLIASLHIKELERLRLVDRYIHNFLLCREKGFPISPDAIAYPPLLPEADSYRDFFRRRGVPLKFSPFLGTFKGRAYPDAYTDEEIAEWGLDPKVRTNYRQKGKLCSAGYNMGVVNQRGDVWPCWKIPKSMGSIFGRFTFHQKIIRCPFDFCGFPFSYFDPDRFEQAVRESGGRRASRFGLVPYLVRDSLMKTWGSISPLTLRKKVAGFRRKRGL